MTHKLRIGIVGGGQLARMLTHAAKNLGYYVVVTDPTPNSPAGQVANKQIVGGYKDEKATRELAKVSDVITIDAEFVNEEVLSQIEKAGKKVFPSPSVIKIIKDKLEQKRFLNSHGIATADFIEVNSETDIQKAIEEFGFPFLLKARFDAYDGKGNYVVKNKKDITRGLEKLKNRKLYIEKFVPFIKELAIMVARGQNGQIQTYPVVETVHTDNICDTVMAPANISDIARKNAENLGKKVVEQLATVGIFGIEMFLKKDDNVLANEIAPRVHNSGHYTIEGTATSQFEQHIRAITGMPLGTTDLIPKAVVMKNILGTRNGPATQKGIEKALAIPNVTVHIYGKHENRVGRKMGHITVIGDSIDECKAKANKAREAIAL